MRKRPGGEISARPLHFFFVCDVSGSMSHSGKIEALNNAVKETIPHMRETAADNPNAKVYVRVLAFSSGAKWITYEPMPVEKFQWSDLSADGVTDMGKALEMLKDALSIPPMEKRALPPVIVLISDGMPTDDYKKGLDALMSIPWGVKSVRISIAIGKDAKEGMDVLEKFIGNSEIKPLQANNPERLVSYIKWASTEVLKTASSPKSHLNIQNANSNIPVPALPSPDIIDSDIDVEDIW